MNVVVVHKDKSYPPDDGRDNLLRFVAGTEPLTTIIFDCINDSISNCRNGSNIIAVPQDWAAKLPRTKLDVVYYEKDLSLPLNTNGWLEANLWCVIFNGRFVTRINYDWLYKALARLPADVVAVNVLPQLKAFYEKVLVTSQSNVVGFRRFYSDSARPAPIPNDWPHCLFVKTGIINKVLVDGVLPLAFPQFIKNCSSNLLTVRGLEVGGALWDLNTEEGLIDLLKTRLKPAAKAGRQLPDEESIEISGSAKLFGQVLFGRNISIGHNALIIGPTIISNDVKIARDSVIKASIIGPGVSIPPNSLVRHRVLLNSQNCSEKSSIMESVEYGAVGRFDEDTDDFRTWPRFSYAGFFKRIIDVIAALIVLVLFIPIMLIIALLIKLGSPGPVFFKDKRQGLHGRMFNCYKFRTMVVGADKIQDRMRVLNQVDGPQFRMEYDPRVSVVGRFLRNTYIDEIPQFFNVLLGQMSVVGPRPSPESENTLCPSWHDARLSVRPGITGLWQVCRTRQPMRDFQEWIYYDTRYVKNLSLKMDLWIFRQTIKNTLENFIDQF